MCQDEWDSAEGRGEHGHGRKDTRLSLSCDPADIKTSSSFGGLHVSTAPSRYKQLKNTHLYTMHICLYTIGMHTPNIYLCIYDVHTYIIHTHVNKHITERYTYFKTYYMYTAIHVTHEYIYVCHTCT